MSDVNDQPETWADRYGDVAYIPAMITTLYRYHRGTTWKRADPANRHLLATATSKKKGRDIGWPPSRPDLEGPTRATGSQPKEGRLTG